MAVVSGLHRLRDAAADGLRTAAGGAGDAISRGSAAAGRGAGAAVQGAARAGNAVAENPGSTALAGAGIGALGAAATGGGDEQELQEAQVVTHPQTGERGIAYLDEHGQQQLLRESQVDPAMFSQLLETIGAGEQATAGEPGIGGALRGLLAAGGTAALGAAIPGVRRGASNVVSRGQGIRAAAGQAFDPTGERPGGTGSIVEALKRGLAADRDARATGAA